MPEEISVVTAQPSSGRKKILFLVLLLLLSLVFNGYFGYQIYQSRKNQAAPQSILPISSNPPASSQTGESAFPIPYLNKSVQDVKITYRFNVTLNNIATEAAKIKLITYTPGGTNFNYFLTPQTKISFDEKIASTSALKIGQSLSVTAEYYPRERSWKVISVDIL